jgi:hypothetical protein
MLHEFWHFIYVKVNISYDLGMMIESQVFSLRIFDLIIFELKFSKAYEILNFLIISNFDVINELQTFLPDEKKLLHQKDDSYCSNLVLILQASNCAKFNVQLVSLQQTKIG